MCVWKILFLCIQMTTKQVQIAFHLVGIAAAFVLVMSVKSYRLDIRAAG